MIDTIEALKKVQQLLAIGDQIAKLAQDLSNLNSLQAPNVFALLGQIADISKEILTEGGVK